MTNFLAAYFFLWLAGGFTVGALVWRFWPLYIASGFAWAAMAFYAIRYSHAGDLIVWALSIFCLAIAILMFFGNWWIPKRIDRHDYSQFSTTEDFASPKEVKQHEKMWGKKYGTDDERKEAEKEARRKKGEWVDEEHS